MAEGEHVDELLGNAAWVRRLAQRMLADRELAEDVAQETWIAGLRSGPSGSELRPWLARVVKNFALQKLRSERARGVRERAVARPESAQSSSETVERAELHARLVQAVLALEEPFRTTILWRYFEELGDDEIARRAGIDVATVRSRVARARTKLREALERRGGGPPEQWLAALVSLDTARLAPVAAGTVIGGTGAIVMGMKLVGATAAAVALVAALWWAWPGERGEPGEPLAAVSAGEVDALDVTDPAEVAGATDTSARSTAAVASATESAAVSAPITRLRGVVLDEDGRAPLVAAHVSHRKGSEMSGTGASAVSLATTTATDAQGRFEIEAPREADVGLWFERDGYFPLKISSPDLPREREGPIEAVLVPLGRIELRVTDEHGAPVAAAPIVYGLNLGRGSQDQRWAHRGPDRPAGSTDSDGRLTIPALPCGTPITLRAARTSDDDWLGVVTIDVHQRVLHHDARLPSKPRVLGRIVRAGGRPADSTAVTWQPFPLHYRASVQAQSGRDGRFELAGLRAGKAEVSFGPPGTPPRVVTLQPGEVRDLGDLEVPDVVALGGRLVARLGPIGGSYFVSAFRDGRRLLSMPVRDGAFEGAVIAGALELMVTRGREWSHGGIDPHNDVVARVALAEPAPDVAIAIDDGRGAIEFVLDGFAPKDELSVDWGLYPPGGQWAVASGQFGAVSSGGRVRIAPVVPGRYRARLSIQNGGAAFSPELVVTAGQVTDGGTLSLGRASLVVRVVDTAGKPLARATVKLYATRFDAQLETDDEGRAKFADLQPGYAQVRIAHGDLGRLVQDGVAIESGEGHEQVFVLGGFAVIEGTLTAGSQPVPSTSVGLQPLGSNDMYNASTDALGRFRLERLPAGRLRVRARGLVSCVDVAPGETRRLDLALDAPRTVRFVRDGAVLDGLFSVAAIGRDPAALAECCWTTGEQQDTTSVLGVPAGPVLYSISCAATGSQQSFVALGSGTEDSVTMPRGAVTIATPGAWNGPLPRARLIDLDGQTVISMWGGPIELALDVDGDGRARVPCLPPGARVALRGHDSRGAPFETEVTTDRDGRAEVRWP